MLELAEEATKDFAELTTGFAEESPKTIKEVEKAADKVEGFSKDAQEKVQKCSKFIAEKSAAMKVMPVAPKIASKPKEGEEEAKEEKPSFAKLSLRTSTVSTSIQKAAREFAAAKLKASKKANANDVLKASNALFAKYD